MVLNYFHATVWKFEKRGVDELTVQFDTLIKDANVRCTYLKDEKMFRIQCLEGDEAYWRFVDLCAQYIETHRNVPADAMEDTRIVRLSETKTGSDLDLELDIDGLLEDDDDGSQNAPLVDISEGPSGDEFTWSPQDSRTIVNRIFSDKILQSIAEDVACGLDPDVERSCIVITNAIKSKVQLVSQRLDNVERDWHRQPIDAQFMHLDKEHDAKLQLWRLHLIPDDTLLRTLTPGDLKNALPRCGRVRLLRHNGDGPTVIVTQAVRLIQKDVLETTWKRLSHPEISRSGLTDRLLGDEYSSHPRSIDAWLAAMQEEDDLLGDADHPLVGGFETLMPTVAPLASGEQRRVDDLDFPSDTESLLDNVSGREVAASEQALEHVSRKLAGTSVGLSPQHPQPSQRHNPASDPTSANTSVRSSGPSSSSRLPTQGRSEGEREIQSWEKTFITAPSRNAGNVLLDNSQPRFTGNPDSNHFPPLTWQGSRSLPKVINPRPVRGVTRTPQILRITENRQDSRPQRQPGRTSQLDKDKEEEADGEIIERLQAEDEVETREYFTSTLHRKPKSSKKKPSSKPVIGAKLEKPEWMTESEEQKGQNHPKETRPSKDHPNEACPSKDRELISSASPPDFSKALLTILEHSRSYKGRLKMEISIGRLLLQGFTRGDAKKFDSKVLPPERMSDAIQRHMDSGDAKVHFTSRLTTSIPEACQIPYDKLFEQEPFDMKVWYELHCEDTDNRSLVIKISGNRDEDVKSAFYSESLGQAAFHFPKRAWDARFVVEGKKGHPEREAVKTLADSITAYSKDREGVHYQIIQWKASKELIVNDVYAKRRLSHRCTKNEQITLHTTEVQHMDRGYQPETPVHAAAILPREDMIKKQLLWFEAKLSIAVDGAFDENVELKTGEDASWQPQQVLTDELLGDMQTVMDWLVTRLDGVGAQNQGYRGSAEDKEMIAATERLRRENRRAEHW